MLPFGENVPKWSTNASKEKQGSVLQIELEVIGPFGGNFGGQAAGVGLIVFGGDEGFAGGHFLACRHLVAGPLRIHTADFHPVFSGHRPFAHPAPLGAGLQHKGTV